MSKRQSNYVRIIRQTDICRYIDCVFNRSEEYRSPNQEVYKAEERRIVDGQESAQRGVDYGTDEGELADLSRAVR